MNARTRGAGLAALILSLGLSGCLETSDDGDSDAPVPDVSYQGKLTATDIEGANATPLGASVLGLSESTGILDLLLSQENPTINIAAVRPLISVMDDCDDGGKRTITTEGNTTTVEYFDCSESGATVNGRATRTGNEDNHRTTIAGLRLTADGVDLSFAGSFSFLDSGAVERLTLHELIVVDNAGTRSVRAENLVFEETDITNGTELAIDGRLFDSELGYVDAATGDADPLFIANGDDFPSSGLLTLTGQGNESVIVMPLSRTQVNVMVDADGDMVAEIDETIGWFEFVTRTGLPTS